DERLNILNNVDGNDAKSLHVGMNRNFYITPTACIGVPTMWG
ncbi:MAG: hypothetical protein ACI9FJ_002701, partial [Alteromonadaceae bacterium]